MENNNNNNSRLSRNENNLSSSDLTKNETLLDSETGEATERGWPKDRFKILKFNSNASVNGKCHPTCQFHSASTYEDFMFIFGGVDINGNPMKNLSCFHFGTRTWSSIEDKEQVIPRFQHSSAVSGDNMFIFGGKVQKENDSEIELSNDLLEFKFERQSWNTISGQGKKPSPRFGHSVSVWERKMYIFGGTISNETTENSTPRKEETDNSNNTKKENIFSNELFEFEFDTLTWAKVLTTGTPPPPRTNQISSVFKDNLYIFGGFDGNSENNLFTIYQLNLKTRVWNPLNVQPPIPFSRSYHSGIMVDSSLYIIDGKESQSTEIFEFDFDFRKWFRIIPRGEKKPPRIGASSVYRGNNLFILGGYKNSPLQIDYLTFGDFDDFEQLDFDEIKDSTSKQFWESNAMKKHPEVLELREKLKSLSNVESYGRTYQASRTEVASSVSSNQVLQLIFDWISQEPSYKKVLSTVEEETQQKYHVKDFSETPDLVSLVSLGKKKIGHKNIFKADINWQNPFESSDPEVPNIDHLPSRLNDYKNEKNIWQENENENIIFEKNEKGANIIKAANLNKIIQKITSEKEKVQDISLIRIILYTHTSFTTSERFLSKLIQRYHIPPNQFQLSEKEFKTEIELPIRAKVTTVIKYWLDKCGWNFDEKLISQLNDFIDGPLSRDGNLSFLKQLRGSLSKLQKKRNLEKFQRHEDKILSSYPEPKLPSTAKLFLKSLAVKSLDDIEVARQLTLIDMAKFQKITPPQFLKKSWLNQKHQAKTIIEIEKRSHDLELWVAGTILDKKNEKSKHRAKAIEQFIRIAEILRQMKNFHTLFTILNGLANPQIQRLQSTFLEISKTSKGTWDELVLLLEPDENYKNYRTALRLCDKPCLPYLPILLIDFLELEDTHEDMENNLINISKRYHLFKLITEVEGYQSRSFSFLPVHQIQQYLLNLPEKVSEDRILELSLLHEPKK